MLRKITGTDIMNISKELKLQADNLEQLMGTSGEYTELREMWGPLCEIWDKIDAIADTLENISWEME